MDDEYILIAEKIIKDFPGTRALENVNFNVKKGEVHALVGENGAGKSTLIKIICGALKSDSGTIFIDGKRVLINNPTEAFKHHIAIMYQEFNLLPDLSVTENLFLGREERTFGFLREKSMRSKSREICKKVGLYLDVSLPVSALSTAEKQLLEIAKGIAYDAKIIFMDEPSATLSESEVNKLFDIIKKLKNEMISVVFISHRLEEIFLISDRVTVLKDGKNVITEDTANFNNKEQIVKYMIGRDIKDFYGDDQKPQKKDSKFILEVKNLNSEKIKNVNFQLKEGEILGFSGLVGSGRTEIMRLLLGIDKKNSGEIVISNKSRKIKSPGDAVKLGLSYVPEDRSTQGLILGWPVMSNLSLAILFKIVKYGFISFKAERNICNKYIKKLNIKINYLEELVDNLSGGNQQKIILGKWLATEPKILVLDEPTRGIDVGAKAEVHKIMRGLVNSGISIIMISSELPEILSMCDRVIVVREGSIVEILNEKDMTEENIMLCATGQKLKK